MDEIKEKNEPYVASYSVLLLDRANFDFGFYNRAAVYAVVRHVKE